MDFEEFYAERVHQFERERKVFRDYVALITPDRNEAHNLEWENKKLDNTASEIKIEIDRYSKEARELESLIHASTAELNALKSAKDARKEQILRLSKLSNPVQRDVTYIIEERFNIRNIRKSNNNEDVELKLGNVANVYKPMKTGELLKMEQRLTEETLKTTTYLQDVQISIREAEEERHRYHKIKENINETDLVEAKQLYQEVHEIEAQSFLAVSELLRLRVNILVAQRQEVEQLELLQRDKEYFLQKEEKTRQQLVSDMHTMQKRVKNELQECTRDFQKQLTELSRKIKELQLQKEWITAEHTKEDNNNNDSVLLEEVEQAKKRYHDLRRRNALEMEGYQTEAAQLSARLQQVDRAYNAHLLSTTSHLPSKPSRNK